MDGVDAAVVRTDGESVSAFGPARTFPYGAKLRAALADALGRPRPDAGLVAEITRRHAEAARAVLARHEGGVSVIGMHGHTVLHDPERGATVQIGDGRALADAVGIDVVHDFRSADVAAGGQGAPLAPLYHEALCRELPRPVAVLNVGGVANVTWIGADGEDPVAFDTGPGNALLDDWVSATAGLPFDRDGAVSAAGRPDPARLARLLDHGHFRRPPPKSLDRLDFDAAAVEGLSAEDGAATLVRFTCEAAARATEFFPAPPERWIVTGGGRRNRTLMAELGRRLGRPAAAAEAAGWDGDALEAQAFAFLAVRALRGLPLSLPSTTGVPAPTAGGVLARARPS